MPLTGQSFLAATGAAGFDAYTGVPCSYLTPLLNAVLNGSIEAGDTAEAGDAVGVRADRDAVTGGGDRAHVPPPSRALGPRYVGATSEGEAVGVAAGMWLAGRQPMVLAQNSGLGNMVNPVTSLLAPLRIPVTLVVTWRGEPGRPDEPQHALMGEITVALCKLLRLPVDVISESAAALGALLARAGERAARDRASTALVLPDGVVSPETLRPSRRRPAPNASRWAEDEGGAPPSRAACLRAVLDAAPQDTALIATTGKCARELFALGDAPRNLYVIGAMGCASAVALGVALHSARTVVVLDGDGAALMKLGNLATIGAAAPRNLVHVVLDNGVHDSTGGQPTAAGGGVDFAAIAAACGYRDVASIRTARGLADAVARCGALAGPALIHVRTAPGSVAGLGRPTVAPDAVAARFREFLQ